MSRTHSKRRLLRTISDLDRGKEVHLFQRSIVCVACSAALACSAQKQELSATAASNVSRMSLAAFVEILKKVDWERAEAVTAQREISERLAGTGWTLSSLTLNRYQKGSDTAPSAAGAVNTGADCVRIADVVNSLGRPPSLTLADPLGFLDISTPEAVEEHLWNGHVSSVQYSLKPRLFYSLEFNPQTGCFRRFDVRRD